METNQEQIYFWLAEALRQPVNSLTEMFYYDRKYQHFFSIMFLDYLLLDENFELAEDVTSTYSKETAQLLASKIQRIEQKDADILFIPRLELKERKRVMHSFASSLTDSGLQTTLFERIENQDGVNRFDLSFENESDQKVKDEWEDFLWNYLSQEVGRFLNLYNINWGTSSVLDLDQTGTFSIDLTKNNKGVRPACNTGFDRQLGCFTAFPSLKPQSREAMFRWWQPKGKQWQDQADYEK